MGAVSAALTLRPQPLRHALRLGHDFFRSLFQPLGCTSFPFGIGTTPLVAQHPASSQASAAAFSSRFRSRFRIRPSSSSMRPVIFSERSIANV